MFRSTGVNGSTEPEPGIHFNLFKLFCLFFLNETKRQREWGLTRRKEYDKKTLKDILLFLDLKMFLIIPKHFHSVEMRGSRETPIENN